MKQICTYHPRKDIRPIRRGLSICINDALELGKIQDTTGVCTFNGQTKLADVGTRIAEPFDAIEYDRAYTKVRHDIISKKDKKD